MPTFSVIIPSYNRERFIEATLQTVFAQTFTDYEIIVVDDGSTDSTVQIVKRYADRVKLLEQPNQGPGAARNLAMTVATGTYCAFLDSDDLWFPWALECFHEAIVWGGNPAMVMCSSRSFEDGGPLPEEHRTPTITKIYPDYFAAARDWFLRGSGLAAVRTDALRRVNGFVTQLALCEDLDLFYRLGCDAGFVHIQSPVLLAYRQHLASTRPNFAGGYSATRYVMDQERAGVYPGGRQRAPDRQWMITRMQRDVAWTCLQRGLFRWGAFLYATSLAWNIRLRRIAFVVGYPFAWLYNALTFKFRAKT